MVGPKWLQLTRQNHHFVFYIRVNLKTLPWRGRVAAEGGGVG